MDIHAAEATIRESQTTIDQLRKELAQERELSDELHFCVQALMKDYVRGELDPRTDEALTQALSTFRETRTYYHN